MLKKSPNQNFIPWRVVWKDNSISTPCRIVFDASQPTSSGFSLNDVVTEKDPIFGLSIPLNISNVESDMLQPQKTWKDQNAYSEKAKELANSFHTQMQKFGSFYDENIQGAPTYKA